MVFPFLSEADRKESAEGGIDPLGMYGIADALAVRMVPGVRERMQRPRFLTAMAVASEVCRDFDAERVARDGVSEPWQVFEWYVVEALVRTGAEGMDLHGLPGHQKALSACRDKVPLSAARYLKTPRVFGFHGVYRVLARDIGVVTGDDLPGETGLELLDAWTRDRGLDGFHEGREPGASRRLQLEQAVSDGLEKGATARSPGWDGWRFLGENLAPASPGPTETAVIRDALLRDPAGFRGEVLRGLCAGAGAEAWDATRQEREFHGALRPSCSAALGEILDAASAYERWARLLDDAFADCLCEMTLAGGRRLRPADLASTPGVRRVLAEGPDAFATALDRLAPLDLAARFLATFPALDPRGTVPATGAEDWTRRLLEHHVAVQKGKPPDGKAPWFLTLDDGGVVVRPLYRRDEGGSHDDRYVHGYRTVPLAGFARDLGMRRGRDDA